MRTAIKDTELTVKGITSFPVKTLDDGTVLPATNSLFVTCTVAGEELVGNLRSKVAIIPGSTIFVTSGTYVSDPVFNKDGTAKPSKKDPKVQAVSHDFYVDGVDLVKTFLRKDLADLLGLS